MINDLKWKMTKYKMCFFFETFLITNPFCFNTKFDLFLFSENKLSLLVLEVRMAYRAMTSFTFQIFVLKNRVSFESCNIILLMTGLYNNNKYCHSSFRILYLQLN